MDIVIRPRQGGKTIMCVELLIAEPEAILIVSGEDRRRAIRDLVHHTLRQVHLSEIRPAGTKPRPVTRTQVEDVMKRVVSPHEGARLNQHSGRVMVDGLERVLEELLNGPVDLVTMDVPAREFIEYDLTFHDERTQKTWEQERQYRQEFRVRSVHKELSFGATYGNGGTTTGDIRTQTPELHSEEDHLRRRNRCLEGCQRPIGQHDAPADCGGTMVLDL